MNQDECSRTRSEITSKDAAGTRRKCERSVLNFGVSREHYMVELLKIRRFSGAFFPFFRWGRSKLKVEFVSRFASSQRLVLHFLIFT